ncbi:MAG: hypothetical protein KJO91_09055 [Gammaproteobacteria bacterium]|nr:hypothetical protein [Gammaproteobacteria bacterium]
MKKLAFMLAALVMHNAHAIAEEDTRKIIQLSPSHRAIVLTEMRQFLAGLQQISQALSSDDMETVTRVARSLGTTMSQHMPTGLKQALPQDFRKLGHSVHSSFDQIALDAESLGDGSHTLSQLAQTISGCVSCHSRYQIRVE